MTDLGQTVDPAKLTPAPDWEALARELAEAVEPMLGTMNYYFGPGARTTMSREKVDAYRRIAAAVEAVKVTGC